MGTRCNIVLEYWGSDQVKYIYRHYDGYPSSVRPELKKYAEAIRWYADNYKEFVKQGDEQLAPHTNEGIKKLFGHRFYFVFCHGSKTRLTSLHYIVIQFTIPYEL